MAEEYELGTVGPIPTVNPNVAKIGEMLKIAKKYADQYYVKENIPLIGGMTLGDFLLGQAPEEVERIGQGNYPFRNPATVVGTGGNRLDVFKTGRFEPVFDVIANVALPAAGTAQMVSRPIARSLGPKAAEMTEDYLTRQGAIANIVEPSPVRATEQFSKVDELGFHSPLENAILKIQQSKGTGDQFLKQLEKTPGVKTEELDVTGIKQYLLDRPTVTKQELLDQMAVSRVKLEQKVLDETSVGVDDYRLRGGEVFDDDDYIRSLADDLHYDMKSDDVIRAQEREALLKADPDRYADELTDPYINARLEEDIDGVLYDLAKQQANDMYYDNPIRRYNDDLDYEIYGNDDMGYSFKSPSGEFLKIGDRNGTYDLGDAEAALRNYHVEQGNLDYGAGGAKYEDYTLPGKYKNYREVLVTLPEKQPGMYPNFDSYFRAKYSDYTDPSSPAYSMAQKDAKRNWDAMGGKIQIDDFSGNKVGLSTGNFQSSHFDEPNILAHTRLDDRIINGKKTLFVEEIQSDWHQAGRRKGYQGGGLTTAEKVEYDALQKEADALMQRKDLIIKNLPPEKMDRMRELSDKKAMETKGVPDAPYKKNWHELMMKQVFNEAVKGNYDAVAFTTGKQQAARYSLSKQISKVNFSEDNFLRAYDKDGKMVISKRLDSPDQIEDYIGKEPAKKLMEQEFKSTYIGEKENGEKIAHGNVNMFNARELSGVDLDVGGEPMKKFYDEIIPNFVNKYGKKYGIGVKKENLSYRGIPSADDVYLNAQKYGYTRSQFDQLPLEEKMKIADEIRPKGEEVHFIELSDMAKKDIKEKGQPLFSGIGLAPAPLLMNDEDN